MKASKYNGPLYNIQKAEMFMEEAAEVLGKFPVSDGKLNPYYIFQGAARVREEISGLIKIIKQEILILKQDQRMAKKPKKKVKKAK